MTRTTSKHVQDILELLADLKKHNSKAERDIIRNVIKDGRLSKNTAAIINPSKVVCEAGVKVNEWEFTDYKGTDIINMGTIEEYRAGKTRTCLHTYTVERCEIK